jgi:alkylated DNA nucleotide flippase Atl1
MPTESNEGQHHVATIRFHRAMARAHDDYADSIAILAEAIEIPAPPQLRGSLQRRVVGLPEMISDRGMTSREVAAATTGDEPNSHTTLKGLVEKGIVEVVEGASPQRFRLALKHRRDRVLRLSRQVAKGEWTTYGDFSIAIYDSSKMALTVARIASRHPAFANPHRVLQAGGTVSPKWRDEDEDKGPEECIRRLTEEGVWDGAKQRANTAGFVDWEELRGRLERDAEPDDLGAARKSMPELHAAETVA